MVTKKLENDGGGVVVGGGRTTKEGFGFVLSETVCGDESGTSRSIK